MPPEKRLDLQNLTRPNLHILLWKLLQKRLQKRGWTFEISPGLTGIYCYENDSRNASRKEVGPSKSHPAIPAYFGPFLLWKWLKKCLQKRGWTFEISPFNTGLFCYRNDSKNALRKEVGPWKSHPAIPAYFAIEMTQKMPREKRLDLRNLTLQYRPILLWKWLKKCLEKRGWTFEISPCNTGLFYYENDSKNASRNEDRPSKSHPAIPAYFGPILL